MMAMPRGKSTFVGVRFISSAVAISMGATMENTTTGLWMNCERMTPIRTYPNIILVTLPLESADTFLARFTQSCVLLKPAATTHMPPTMITLELAK